MLKLENSIRGLSFSRVAFDLTIQGILNNYGIRSIKGFAYSAPMAFDRALCTPT